MAALPALAAETNQAPGNTIGLPAHLKHTAKRCLPGRRHPRARRVPWHLGGRGHGGTPAAALRLGAPGGQRRPRSIEAAEL